MTWQDLKLYSIPERGGLCPLVLSNTIGVIERKIARTHTQKKKKSPTTHNDQT